MPCFVASDPFGETRAVLCQVTDRHGVFGVVDEAWHGVVTEVETTSDPAGKRRRMERNAKRQGGEFHEVDPEQAWGLLRDGATSFHKKGGPDGRLTPQPQLVTADHESLVDEFLASPYGHGFSGEIPRLLAASCATYLGCDPTLIGPTVLERLLLIVFPATVVAPDQFGERVPPVVEAWSRWLAGRNDLPRKARRRLEVRTRLTLLRFGRAWYGPAASPLRRYVADLSGPDVVERRTFAVPPPDDRAGGQDLDAADEGDRATITLLEVTARGLPPHRLPSYLAVARQLWDDDPPQLWEAARRLRDSGQSREAVLDLLAHTWEETGGEGYTAELRRLA
jgi:hypothetical protein